MLFQGDDETPGVDFPGLLVPILLQISGVSCQHFFFSFKPTFSRRIRETRRRDEKLVQVSGIWWDYFQEDGQRDSGAILTPLLQLSAPLIGPLVGPLVGPLSRQSSQVTNSKIRKKKFIILHQKRMNFSLQVKDHR